MSPILLRTNLFRGFNGQILKNLEDDDEHEDESQFRILGLMDNGRGRPFYIAVRRSRFAVHRYAVSCLPHL
jgi:hypothetical protein